MTEVKKDAVPTPDVPKGAIQERRIVLPEGGGTPEEVKQAQETYKEAKAQFNKAQTDNDTKQKELAERNEDKPGEKLDTGLATEPSSKQGAAVSYEMKSHIEGSPNNVTYSVVAGHEIPKDAVKINYAPATAVKEKSQEEIALDTKKEAEKKVVLDALKIKHEKEMDEILSKFDFSTLNSDAKKVIHADALADGVVMTHVSDDAKKEALKSFISFDDKPIDFKNLTPEQVEIVQQHTAKKYLESLKGLTEEAKNDPEKLKNQLLELEKTQPGITEFVSKQKIELINEENFFKAAKENPALLEKAIESIKKDGLVVSGIDPESEIGKSLIKVIEQNVDEYLELAPPEANTLDIKNFKGLKDVIQGGYKDLIYADKNFLLGEDHPLKKARDAVMQNFLETASQRDESSPTFQSEIAQDFTDATGLDGRQEIQNISRGASRFHLSPMCRFLADLFAPFGALFPPPAGDFWRSYLNDSSSGQSVASRNAQNRYGKGQSSPVEGTGGIAEAEPGSIHAAARKYLGPPPVTESGNPDLVREFHKSGGSAVQGAGPDTAWCMSFVQHVLRKDMGFGDKIGPPTAWAADGHSIGRHVETKDAQPGDIVMVHSSAASSGNHIGFVDKVYPDGSVDVLGGNQGSPANSVRIDRYPAGKIDEIRTLQADKKTSENASESAGGVEGLVAGKEQPTSGKVTTYQQYGDKTPDSYSSQRVGSFSSQLGPLNYGDLAVSRDVEAQFNKMGIKPGDKVALRLANGKTIQTRWMDRTAKEYKGRTLTGRFDIFQKTGSHPDQDSQVVGIIA